MNEWIRPVIIRINNVYSMLNSTDYERFVHFIQQQQQMAATTTTTQRMMATVARHFESDIQ